MELDLLGEPLQGGAELELLEVELLHRYYLDRGVAPFAQWSPVLHLLHLDCNLCVLKVLDDLGARVLDCHPKILARDGRHLSFRVDCLNLLETELPENLD